MTGETTAMSPLMEQTVRDLAIAHGIDLAQPGATMCLCRASQPVCWLMVNLDGHRVQVARYALSQVRLLRLELDMVFAVTPAGWQPIELVHSPEIWQTFRQMAQAAGLSIYDEQGEVRFAAFTDYWAGQLHQQGWLTEARSEEETVAKRTEGVVRYVGCQSTHPGCCYGHLWQCSACQKIVCCAEGTDHHPELCDDCWCKQYHEQEVDDVPF